MRLIKALFDKILRIKCWINVRIIRFFSLETYIVSIQLKFINQLINKSII